MPAFFISSSSYLRSRRLAGMLVVTMSQPLQILHLSDLSFGHHGRFAGEDLEALARRFQQIVEEALTGHFWERQVNLCIITGAIAEVAHPQEYQQALTFYGVLAGALGLERTRFIFTPGHHDDSQLEDFTRQFYGQARAEQSHVLPLGHGAWLHHFPEQQLSVAALNSCERGASRQQEGFFSPQQAEALLGQWRKDEVRHWLKVLAVNHNPVVPSGFKGREHLRDVATDSEATLVLHGHPHTPRHILWPWTRDEPSGHCLILGAGRWGTGMQQLPPEEPSRTMHFIRLDPSKPGLRSHFSVLEPEVEPRSHAQVQVPPGSSEPPPTALDPEALQGLITEYRRRLAKRYQRWEPGTPTRAALDSMYLPLRLARERDLGTIYSGHVLEPPALLARKKHLVICGELGSGKSTWMRWTFRRLLELPTAIPFMLELNKLARMWEELKAQGEARTLDFYLRTEASAAGGADWQEALPQVFQSPTGPRPVLLIDGWDAAGPLGRELREALRAFLASFPRVLAFVSSRPYGQSLPSEGEGFELLELQPFSEEELSQFVSNFRRHVCGEGEVADEASALRIRRSLATSHEAVSFARTPRLLTLLLLISRDRPLPDKRHRLYEECIRYLLSARPEERARQGAQPEDSPWCPEDSEECLRVAASLAAQVQQQGYEGGNRELLVRTWKEFESLLPAWRRKERAGFLTWLAATGLMVDRRDGSWSFACLEFQEYLTAHHLESVCDGHNDRLRRCWDWMKSLSWWETLRLWAAKVSDRNPYHLTRLLERLVEGKQSAGYWLAGALFADGLGTNRLFQPWASKIVPKLLAGKTTCAHMSAWSWALSPQESRRKLIAERLEAEGGEHTWLTALRVEDWQETARLGKRARSPITVERFISEATVGQGVARARVLWGAHPLWPLSPGELALLRLFPTRRILAGARLQEILSLSPPESEFRQAAHRLLTAPPSLSKRLLGSTHSLARGLARPLAQYLGEDLARDLAQDIARYLQLDFAQDFGDFRSQYFVGYFSGYFEATLEGNLALEPELGMTEELAREWARSTSRSSGRSLAQRWAPAWKFAKAPAWFADFVALELDSMLRSGTRAALADDTSEGAPHWELLKVACQHSLDPFEAGTALEEALARYPVDGEPLWPALARHIARSSTEQDRALLSDLAQHPEKRKPPLSDGLKYYVRGDLVFNDGRELTLDALCDELGLPRLPYLEDMPPELEVNWNVRD
jgi:hypothetical protein